MLNSSEFKGNIKKEIKPYLDDNYDGNVNPVMLWDAAKAVLFGKIISESAFISKMKTKTFKPAETAHRTGTTT